MFARERLRLAVPRGDQHRAARARLDDALGLKTADFSRGVGGRMRWALCATNPDKCGCRNMSKQIRRKSKKPADILPLLGRDKA